jgi:hypothetical protein
MVSGLQPVLSEQWAAGVKRDGHVELGAVSQAMLLAAGVTEIGPGGSPTPVVVTSFDRLDESDRRVAIEHSRDDLASDPVASLTGAIMANPTVRGTWLMTPPWFETLDRSSFFRLSGMRLPDGSSGVLEGALDARTSRMTMMARTLTDTAARLAASFFAPEPPPPAGAAAGWTDASGGGLAQLTVVWPKGRGTRAATWRITRTSSASPTAFVQIRRDFGMKRSVDATLDESQLAARLLELLESATAEGSARG